MHIKILNAEFQNQLELDILFVNSNVTRLTKHWFEINLEKLQNQQHQNQVLQYGGLTFLIIQGIGLFWCNNLKAFIFFTLVLILTLNF